MFRTLDVVMIAAVIGTAAWTFKVKYDSEAAVERLGRLEKRLQIEREGIDILHADWSLLTSPDRLEKLVERYHDDLPLEPVTAEHIGSLGDIPDRTELPPLAGGGQATKSAQEKPDANPDSRTITGSIGIPADRPAAPGAASQ